MQGGDELSVTKQSIVVRQMEPTWPYHRAYQRYWVQSRIAVWKWIPEITTLKGCYDTVANHYIFSRRTFYWGQWVIAWRVMLYQEDYAQRELDGG